MGHPIPERRRHRRFRILYIGLRAFLDRVVLGRTPAPAPVPASPGHPPPPVPRPGAGLPVLTGIPEIDRQHRDLLKAVHGLQRALQSGAGEEAALAPLAFLQSYCETHFRIEEAYMRRIGYPHLEAHMGEHAQLGRRVRELQARVARGESGTALECSILLFQWMKDHIAGEDADYVDHARATGAHRGIRALVAEPLDDEGDGFP